MKPATKSEKSRVGKVVADLKAKGAAPGQVAEMGAVYRRKLRGAAYTPEALMKHWDQLGAGTLAFDAGGDPDAAGDDGSMPPRLSNDALDRALAAMDGEEAA